MPSQQERKMDLGIMQQQRECEVDQIRPLSPMEAFYYKMQLITISRVERLNLTPFITHEYRNSLVDFKEKTDRLDAAKLKRGVIEVIIEKIDAPGVEMETVMAQSEKIAYIEELWETSLLDKRTIMITYRITECNVASISKCNQDDTFTNIPITKQNIDWYMNEEEQRRDNVLVTFHKYTGIATPCGKYDPKIQGIWFEWAQCGELIIEAGMVHPYLWSNDKNNTSIFPRIPPKPGDYLWGVCQPVDPPNVKTANRRDLQSHKYVAWSGVSKQLVTFVTDFVYEGKRITSVDDLLINKDIYPRYLTKRKWHRKYMVQGCTPQPTDYRTAHINIPKHKEWIAQYGCGAYLLLAAVLFGYADNPSIIEPPHPWYMPPSHDPRYNRMELPIYKMANGLECTDYYERTFPEAFAIIRRYYSNLVETIIRWSHRRYYGTEEICRHFAQLQYKVKGRYADNISDMLNCRRGTKGEKAQLPYDVKECIRKIQNTATRGSTFDFKFKHIMHMLPSIVVDALRKLPDPAPPLMTERDTIALDLERYGPELSSSTAPTPQAKEFFRQLEKLAIPRTGYT